MRNVTVFGAALLCAAPSLADPPKFVHKPPAEAVIGQDLIIVAVITAPGGVFAPSVWYRVGGELSFKKLRLTPSEGGEFKATIPGAEIVDDVEYCLEAFDARDLLQGTWTTRKNPNHVPAVAAAPKEQPVAQQSAPPAPSPPRLEPAPLLVPAKRRSLSPAIATAAGAALCAGAAALFGVQAQSAADRWRGATAEPAWSSARSDSQSAMNRANAAWIAAGALAALSAALFVVEF